MPITISGSTGIAGVDGTVASPAVQGADTNTGVYYPAADQVAVTANGSQVWLATASGVTVTGTESISGNLSFNSGYGSAAVAYGCRAWVNFNGTGVVAIRASGNVTSITDNGVGDYTVNMTSAMPDVNYVAICNGTPPVDNTATVCTKTGGTYSTSAVQIRAGTPGVGFQDFSIVNVSIFR